MAKGIDIYEQVTDSLVRIIEAGVAKGRVRWKNEGMGFPLRVTGERYQGINVLLLWGRAMECGYESPYWMTFRQALELGGHVRKGEKGTFSVFYGRSTSKDEGEETGSAEGKSFRFLKQFCVFNASQIEGLPEKFYPAANKADAHNEPRIEEIDAFVKATGARIEHGGNSAFYHPSKDMIQMPNFGSFHTAAFYYATLTHELTHWTKAPNRLDRNFGAVRYGDQGYAKEELVAEIASAFLGAHFELPVHHIEDHAAYVASWAKAIKDDKKFIMVAAAKAQQAATYLLSFSENKLEQAA